MPQNPPEAAGAPGGTSIPQNSHADVGDLVRQAVRDELDEVIPHVVAALRRDRAFDSLQERLRTAELRLDSRRDRPVVTALLSLLHRLRHLDFEPDVRSSLDAELVTILNDAGFEEIGAVGEAFDPVRHEPLEGRTSDSTGIVARVYATGLGSFGDIVVRAQVGVSPATDPGQHSRPDKET